MEGGSHKGGVFVVLEDGLIEEVGVCLEEVVDVDNVVLLDVVVEEFVLGVEGLAVAHIFK